MRKMPHRRGARGEESASKDALRRLFNNPLLPFPSSPPPLTLPCTLRSFFFPTNHFFPTTSSRYTSMASIVLFPTVATHRKLPHLPPKGPKESNVSNDDHSAGLTQDHSIERRRSLANEDTGVSPTSTSQLTIEPGSTAIDTTLQLRNGSAQTKAVDLMITTQLPKQGDPKRSHEHDHLSHSTPAMLSVTTSRPPSTLPPSGASSSSSSSLPSSLDHHDSRSIKSTLYDAFGCLYHPVQHTHPSLVASSNTSTPTSAGTTFHQIVPRASSVNHRRRSSASMVRSSPRDSPALCPHAGGYSAPITPLDLSSADGGGCFWHGSSSTTSGPGSTSWPWYHFFAHHTQPHPHTNPSRRSSSFHHEEGALHFPDTASPNKSRSSRRPSLDDHLSPAEHPVLCSLQALSLAHTHLPEYYHPHLGHDLGHDRVPILDPENHCLAAQTLSASFAQPPPALTPSEQQQHQRPSGGSSPFPMDHGSDDSRVVI
ncbi:MAG: hypothetical protein J3Q66DRAFT_353100 [Benniella sp.]|nr:MAG: hypothetical protein J3Q66DRAFT_353100 [Benniella sp.]